MCSLTSSGLITTALHSWRCAGNLTRAAEPDVDGQGLCCKDNLACHLHLNTDHSLLEEVPETMQASGIEKTPQGEEGKKPFPKIL